MFVDVGLGLMVGSVHIVCTASSYEFGGTDRLGAGTDAAGKGTTSDIGVSPSTDGAMLFAMLLLVDYCVTCCYPGCAGDVRQTIMMVSSIFLGFYTVSSISTRI